MRTGAGPPKAEVEGGCNLRKQAITEGRIHQELSGMPRHDGAADAVLRSPIRPALPAQAHPERDQRDQCNRRDAREEERDLCRGLVDCGVRRSALLRAFLWLRAALDLDAAALRVLAQRNLDLEDAVLEPRRRLVQVSRLRKRNHPREAAVHALRPVDAFLALDLDLLPALALQDQRAIPYLEPDVIRRESRDVRPHHEATFALDHIDRRRPDRRETSCRAPLEARPSAPKPLEHPVHVLQHATHEGERAQSPETERPERQARRAPLQAASSLLLSTLARPFVGLRFRAGLALLLLGSLRSFDVPLSHDCLRQTAPATCGGPARPAKANNGGNDVPVPPCGNCNSAAEALSRGRHAQGSPGSGSA